MTGRGDRQVTSIKSRNDDGLSSAVGEVRLSSTVWVETLEATAPFVAHPKTSKEGLMTMTSKGSDLCWHILTTRIERWS